MAKSEKSDKEENIIYLGEKPFVKYLTAAYMIVENHDIVLLKSRGKFTSKAIDLAEVMKVRFKMDMDDIKIDSEEFENKEGKQIRVSIIEITMKKPEDDSK